MIAVRMADENMADRPSGDCPQKGIIVIVIFRAGVDNRQRMLPDQIAVGAMEGEWSGIVGGKPRDSGEDRDRLAIGGIEVQVEVQCHRQSCCNKPGWKNG